MDFDFKIQCVEDYQKYIDYLKSLSKNESVEHKARHVAILNTKQDVIAISMASIRKTAKQIFRNGYDWFLEYSLIQNYKDEYYIHIYNTYLFCNACWLIFSKMPSNDRIAYLSWVFIPFILLYPILNNSQSASGFIRNKKILMLGLISIIVGVNLFLKYIR